MWVVETIGKIRRAYFQDKKSIAKIELYGGDKAPWTAT